MAVNAARDITGSHPSTLRQVTQPDPWTIAAIAIVASAIADVISELQMPEIERSRGWMVAAVILAIAFIAGLGPGVKFHSR